MHNTTALRIERPENERERKLLASLTPAERKEALLKAAREKAAEMAQEETE